MKGSTNSLLDWQQWNTSYNDLLANGSYSCATTFYLETQSSCWISSYLILRLLSDIHTTYLFTGLSPDPLPTLPLFSQVSYHYGTIYS